MVNEWLPINYIERRKNERRAESRATTTNAEQIFCFRHFKEKQNANGEGKVAYSGGKTRNFEV